MFKSRIKDDNEKTNKEILVITYAFVGLFVALIIYLAWFTAFKSDSFINNSYNVKRSEILAGKTVRGPILSADGQVLAATNTLEDGTEVRVYPYANVFAHAVGFMSQGCMGVESITNYKLLTCNDFFADRIVNEMNGIKNQGDTMVTTLDTSLQMTAYNALGNKKGAVVLTDVKTGHILALVSKPDFDPNMIDAIWEDVNKDTENSPLVNRATQGLYPPGSTFKIVTALEFIKENPEPAAYQFDCTGRFEFDDVVINCYHGQDHGHLDLEMSFAKSCNSSFANISSTLDKGQFGDTCRTLLFNRKLPCPFTYKPSSVDLNKKSSSADLIQAGIGQGKTQISPIHMNMITQAVANRGILMQPMVIDEIRNSKGAVVRDYTPDEYGRLMSEQDAVGLKYLMKSVVEKGTGSRLQGTVGYDAAGKTGSAEYSKDKTKSHAWFTGFAPFDDPQVAVTVIVEGGGSGGETAVPIARMVLDDYFN
ncbi:MAG: penicillin-binding protein 2 [Lachnospiraceae bacterium]|nr:penicillin-binding protein 2 [Lachnospiraceae bacterium]